MNRVKEFLQGTGHFPARARQRYRCLETDHQHD